MAATAFLTPSAAAVAQGKGNKTKQLLKGGTWKSFALYGALFEL